ncbi:MAG TPA: hypothetical protein DIT01_14330 [Lentisphaeria bacterium]|nr:hypothetical protein [Lentisphaeria bacterium]
MVVTALIIGHPQSSAAHFGLLSQATMRLRIRCFLNASICSPNGGVLLRFLKDLSEGAADNDAGEFFHCAMSPDEFRKRSIARLVKFATIWSLPPVIWLPRGVQFICNHF